MGQDRKPRNNPRTYVQLIYDKGGESIYNQLKTKEQKTNFSLFSSSVPSPELITQRVLHTHTKEQQQQQKKNHLA